MIIIDDHLFLNHTTPLQKSIIIIKNKIMENIILTKEEMIHRNSYKKYQEKEKTIIITLWIKTVENKIIE